MAVFHVGIHPANSESPTNSECFAFVFALEVSAGAPCASARPLGAPPRRTWGFTLKLRGPQLTRNVLLFQPSTKETPLGGNVKQCKASAQGEWSYRYLP